MSGIKPAIFGVVLGCVFILAAHMVPPQPARQIIALFLAFTACVYAGALLAQQTPAGPIALAELAIAAVVFVCAMIGLRASTMYLAGGYIIHGIWDLFHHPRAVSTRVAVWFPPLCSAFDFVVALALLVGPWRPMA